jgi:hypothetical protein
MLDPVIIEAEKKWAQLVVTNAKSILRRSNKDATGNLINSVRYTVNSQGKIIFSFAKEGKYVQSGRRKGARFPPPAPITRWIREKGINATGKDGKPIGIKSLTYLISRSIHKNGIKPLPFMDMAIKQSKEQLKKELKKSVTKSVVARLKAAAKS